MKKFKGSYIINLEWSNKDRFLTSQMIRDKILAPLQELWITHTIDKFTLEEGGKSYLERKDTEKRKKGTYPKQTKTL